MKLPIQFFTRVYTQLLGQNTKQIALYKHRYRSRKALLKLDENRLKDIGISKAQAEEEARTPFWKGGSVKPKEARESIGKRRSRLIKVSN